MLDESEPADRRAQLDRLLAIWSGFTRHGADSAATEMVFADCLSRWPFRRVRLGVTRTVERLTGPDAPKLQSEKQAFDFVRGVISKAEEWEWKPGAERPDKAVPVATARRAGPARFGARPTEVEDANLDAPWRAAFPDRFGPNATAAAAAAAGGDDGPVPF